ncbi:MAG TPA: hypothetical protein VM468_01930 [Mycoplana sp.]|nr:hypothetical protein [Mycoplana sp.]
MLKFFFSKGDRCSEGRPRDPAAADWLRDPLAHPDIEAMDERQRADLPFRTFPMAADDCGSTAPCRAG